MERLREECGGRERDGRQDAMVQSGKLQRTTALTPSVTTSLVDPTADEVTIEEQTDNDTYSSARAASQVDSGDRRTAATSDEPLIAAHTLIQPDVQMRTALARQRANSSKPTSLLNEQLHDGEENCLERAATFARPGRDELVFLHDARGEAGDQNGAGHVLIRDRSTGRVWDPNDGPPPTDVSKWPNANTNAWIDQRGYTTDGVVPARTVQSLLAAPPNKRRQLVDAAKNPTLSRVATRLYADDEDKVEVTKRTPPRGQLYPATKHTLGGDPFTISVTPENGPRNFRSANVTIRYDGDGDPSAREAKFVLQLPPGRAINAKIEVEKRTFGKTYPGGAKGTETIKVDVFGDGSHVVEIGAAAIPNKKWDPAGHRHSFWAGVRARGRYRPGDRTISVKPKNAVPAGSRPPAKPATTTPAEEGPALPSDAALDVAQQRVADLEGDHSGLVKKLEADRTKTAAEGTTGQEKVTIAKRADRVASVAHRSQRPLEALAALDDDKLYLTDLRGDARRMVGEVRDKYETALQASYDGDDKTSEAAFAEADRAMAALPHRLNSLYVERGKGVESLTTQMRTLETDIEGLRAKNKRARLARPIDTMLGMADRKTKPSSRLSKRLRQVRDDHHAGKPSQQAVHQLTSDSQRSVGLLSMVAMEEQMRSFSSDLDHIADKVPFVDSQKKVADSRAKEFDGYLTQVETAAKAVDDAAVARAKTYETGTPEEKTKADEKLAEKRKSLDTTVDSVLAKFTKSVSSEAFKKDVENIEGRLGTIATVNTVGKVAAIVAASALTAGAAGAAVGATLEAAGASAFVAGTGAFAAEVTAFTLASRAGNDLVMGGNQTSFSEDLLTNGVMFGTLRGASTVYGHLAKGIKETHRVAYYAGHAATGMVSLQAFSEMHHRVKEGRFMDGEERYRSVIQNSVVFGSIEVGRFIGKPLNARIEKAVGRATRPLFKKQLAKIDTQLAGERAALNQELTKIQSDAPGARDAIPETVQKMEKLWNREVELLQRAHKRKAITREELDVALDTHRAKTAEVELELATNGVNASFTGGQQSFRSMRPGVVAFEDAKLDLVKQRYEQDGGSFKEVKPGMYRGKLGDQTTLYFAESRVRQDSIPIDERIATLVEAKTGGRITDEGGLLDRIANTSKGNQTKLRATIERMENELRDNGKLDVETHRVEIERTLDRVKHTPQALVAKDFDVPKLTPEQVRADQVVLRRNLESIASDARLPAAARAQARAILAEVKGDANVWDLAPEIEGMLKATRDNNLRRDFYKGTSVRAAEAARVAKIRDALTVGDKPMVGGERTVSYGEYSINGEQGRLASASMPSSSRGYPEGMVKDNPRQLLRPTETSDGNPRTFDAEYKILNDLANRYAHLRGKATGRVRLYVEDAPCSSCSDVINQFRDLMGPGLKVEVIWGRKGQ